MFAGEESGLWYATDAASLSLAGRTSLHGCLRLPRHGVQYGQIRSVFFCGERIEGAVPLMSARSFRRSEPMPAE